MDWDDFMLAIMEGIDGIDYKQARKIHKVLYPEAKVRVKGEDIIVEWPDR